MKHKLTALVVGLSLTGLITTSSFATTNPDVKKLTRQVAQLEKQVKSLQKSKSNSENTNTVSTSNVTADATKQNRDSLTYFPMDLGVPGKSYVSTGHYIGIPLEYAGGDLIINAPSVNQDLSLLKVRKNIDSHLAGMGVQETPSSTHLLLSGIVEGQAKYAQIGGGHPTSDIDISSAGLDAYILGPGSWLSSLIAFTYDNNPGTISGSLANNARVQNSRVYLSQAFVTVGNLIKTPFYFTFGQLTVAFGTFSSNMVSTPLTKLLAGTKARAVVLGYHPQVDNTFYAAGYAFKGDTHLSGQSRINNGGINFGYQFTGNTISGDIGGGVIANIADSAGMQNVGNSSANFNGFGGSPSAITGNPTGSETIAHRVPAYDVRGIVSIGKQIDVLAEYISASKQFSPSDLTMNGHGAKPQALNAEIAYTFNTFAHPSSIAVGYGMTKDALALGLPAKRYSFVYNTSIWNDTLQSIEFRHEVNYSASSTASGSGIAAASESGKSDNIVTAQFDVYF